MIFFGALIPALMSTEGRVAAESGHLLWISSLANAAGYLVYVLVGHPFLDSGILLVVIAIILLTAGLLATKFRFAKKQWALAALSVILITTLVLRWQEKYFYLAHWVNKLKPDDYVKVFKSGAESATLVQSEKGVWISYNGHPSIFVQLDRKINFSEMAVGTIPALTAPRLDNALVIGFGTGITAGTTSRIFKHCDIVEINKAFYEMMPALKHAHLDIENNPSAKLHLADGRAFLVGKERVYDAILNTVSAPTYFSASKIYTKEFYEKVVKALKADGVFSMWLAWGNISKEGAESILSALRNSFRYCELRYVRGNYYVLTCSNEPIVPRRFSDLHAHPGMVMQLQNALPGFDIDSLFEDTHLSDNIFDHFEPDLQQANTDDHPILEFQLVRHLQTKQVSDNLFMTKQDLFNINVVNKLDLTNHADFARKASTFSWFGTASASYLNNFSSVLAKDAGAASMFFTYNGLLNTSYGRYDEAAKMFNAALGIKPDLAVANNGIGELLLLYGKIAKAEKHFKSAIQTDPGSATTYQNLADTLILQSKVQEAIQTLRKAASRNELKGSLADIHLSLAKALRKSGKQQEAKTELAAAVQGYRKELQLNQNSIEMIAKLAYALTESGDLEQAAKYSRQAVELFPYDIDNQLLLAKILLAQGLREEATSALEKAIAAVSYIGAEKDGIARLKNTLGRLNHKKP